MIAKPEGRVARELVIVFLDLSVYTQDARRTADDARLADIVDGYYERVADRCGAAGGTVVKFIGGWSSRRTAVRWSPGPTVGATRSGSTSSATR